MASEQGDFAGLRVAAFESRRATDMERLLTRAGAVASVSPSMREVPLAAADEVVAYARRLVAAEFDLVILMTGVGLRLLVRAVDPQPGREAFLAALGTVTTVARGPKPTAALKDLGLRPSYQVPEPNTWRQILALIDAEVPVAGTRVAIQEYGLPNADLAAGLTARGATVTSAPIYRWGLPEDTRPLEANLRAIAAGRVDVVLFTSSQQVVHVLEIAVRLGIETPVHQALQRVLIASIGPTTSETLRQAGIPVDLEAAHPKMGHLVRAAAASARELIACKRGGG